MNSKPAFRNHISIISIFAVVLLSTPTFAQIGKDTWVVGFQGFGAGNGMDNSQGIGLNRWQNNYFDLTLQGGYFITDRFQIGLNLGGMMANSIQENNSGDPNFLNASENRSNYKGFRILPFVRHFTPIGEKLAFFAEFQAGYANIVGNETGFFTFNNDRTEWERDFESNSIISSLRGGFIYFVGKKVGLEASFGDLRYERFNRKESQNGGQDFSTQGSYFGLNMGMSALSVGAKVYF